MILSFNVDAGRVGVVFWNFGAAGAASAFARTLRAGFALRLAPGVFFVFAGAATAWAILPSLTAGCVSTSIASATLRALTVADASAYAFSADASAFDSLSPTINFAPMLQCTK
ncbi:MAG: hypothetical protein ACTHKM_00410 [Tsuneonella sp.]